MCSRTGSCASRGPVHYAGVATQRRSVGLPSRPDRLVSARRPPGAEFAPKPELTRHSRARGAKPGEAREAVLREAAVTPHGDAEVLERIQKDRGVADDLQIDEEALEPSAVAVDTDAERPLVSGCAAVDVAAVKRPAHRARVAAIYDSAVRFAYRSGYANRAGRLGLVD